MEFTTFAAVCDAVDAFERETGKLPLEIHLSRHELSCLNQYARAHLLGEWGDGPDEYIYGVLIVHSETGGKLTGG